MSAPVHRDDETDDFRLYAPPRVRERVTASDPDATGVNFAADSSDSGDTEVQPKSGSPDGIEGIVSPAEPALKIPADEPATPWRPEAPSSPRMPAGVGGPNIHSPPARPAPTQGARGKLSLRFSPIETPEDEWPATLRGRRAFEGDVAVKALRDRMSLDPEFVPAPPVRARKRAVMPWVSWLTVAAAVAAMVASGIAWMTQPTTRQTALKDDRSVITPVVAPKPVGPQLAGISTAIRPLARLIVEDRQAFTNEGLAIGISLDGAMGGEVALLTGLAAGTRLSLGSAFGANGWRLPARDLTQALAYAPKDFAGVMEGTVDVRTENDVLIDSRPIRLAWLPKQSEEPVREARLETKEAVQPVVAIPSLDAEELATLMRRGEEYLKTGDIAAARLVLRRAANAGHAQAALALGATFDPVILAELGVLGFPPDPAQARSWYDKAARLGLDEAQRRLERLARAAN
jgi:hypothetical protein